MIQDWSGKRYWIVGASEGLGRALCAHLSRAGIELVLSARSREKLEALAAELPGRSTVVPLDVSDSNSVAESAEAVQAGGPLDGLVWLAGVYWPQSARDWVPDEVEAMCDVNFTGLARMLGRVVPGMVDRDAGRIVIVGSLSGFRGLPGSIGYGSSKAGVMHLAESLHADLRRTGVRVQLVNPGFIRTRLTDKNDFHMPFLMTPEAAALQVWEHMQTPRFRRNFPTLFSWLFRLGNLLPDGVYYRLFS